MAGADGVAVCSVLMVRKLAAAGSPIAGLIAGHSDRIRWIGRLTMRDWRRGCDYCGGSGMMDGLGRGGALWVGA